MATSFGELQAPLFGSPDPRMLARAKMAQQLVETGSSTAPVQSPLEGLARALTGVVGGYQQRKVYDAAEEKQKSAQSSLAEALTKSGGDPSSLIQNLSGNTDLQPFALQLQMEQAKQGMKGPNLPRGYRMNQQTGQAELIPGLDASFAKKGSAVNVTVNSGAPTGPTRNKVQEKILNSTSTRARLEEINQRFKPEFLEIGSKAGSSWSAIKEKAGVGLEPNEQAKLQEFSQFRSAATELFNTTLKELSGTALSPGETERLTKQLPVVGTGVFDGDSPTEFKAKAQRFTESVNKAIMKNHYINTRGFSVDDVDIDQMPGIMNRRGAELEQEIKAQFPNQEPEAIKGMVKQQLANEFGLVYGK